MVKKEKDAPESKSDLDLDDLDLLREPQHHRQEEEEDRHEALGLGLQVPGRHRRGPPHRRPLQAAPGLLRVRPLFYFFNAALRRRAAEAAQGVDAPASREAFDAALRADLVLAAPGAGVCRVGLAGALRDLRATGTPGVEVSGEERAVRPFPAHELLPFYPAGLQDDGEF